MKYVYGHMEEFAGIEFPDFKQYSGNLILYGAGINGALCAFALKEQGIAFLAFCDSDPLKQSTSYIGYPVYSPEECSRRFPTCAVLFDVYCSGTDISQLMALGYNTVLFPASLMLGMDCEKAAAFITEQLGKGDDGYAFREEVDAFQVYEWIDEYMIRGVGYVNHRKEMSRSINLDLTDRCTLRCRNCLALKPYFTERAERPWTEMEETIDRLLSLKWFRRFHLLGGEPFIYPYLDKVLKKLCAAEEVEHVNIITNGTVLPHEAVLQEMKNTKVMVRISYYGEQSSRYKELEELCRQKNINVRVHAQRWKDIGRPLDTQLNLQQAQVCYNGCSQKAGAFFYVLHGKATLCPFAANTLALGVYEPDGGDVIDIINTTSADDLLERFRALYSRERPLTACRYCNGWLPYATKPVPVAEQYHQGEQPCLPQYDQ